MDCREENNLSHTRSCNLFRILVKAGEWELDSSSADVADKLVQSKYESEETAVDKTERRRMCKNGGVRQLTAFDVQQLSEGKLSGISSA